LLCVSLRKTSLATPLYETPQRLSLRGAKRRSNLIFTPKAISHPSTHSPILRFPVSPILRFSRDISPVITAFSSSSVFSYLIAESISSSLSIFPSKTILTLFHPGQYLIGLYRTIYQSFPSFLQGV